MALSVDNFDESQFIGLPAKEAERLAREEGWTVRVISAEAEAVSLTMMLGRMTLLINESGRVKHAWVEGER